MENDLKINDEPVLKDCIGHYELVEHVIRTLIHCDPPYVIGVSGSWGAGKSSFLHKIWALMGGEFNITLSSHTKANLCTEACANYNKLRQEWSKKSNLTTEVHQHGFKGWVVIRFNPWQHQFEANPIIALLHEIRAQYSLTQKVKEKIEKHANVITHSLLDMLCNTANKWSLGVLPKIDVDKIQKRGEHLEAQNFETPLTSQSFRELFEQAIDHIAGENGRLLICIDDLDRCEGEVAYRLLESLKLYLNANNCVFILGMDQTHLEKNIASCITKEPANTRDAREYLDKMLQDRFVLPVPRDMKIYIRTLLAQRKTKEPLLTFLLPDRFTTLVDILDRNLPHNPRKIKLFLAGWERYFHILQQQHKSRNESNLQWKLTIILSYLAIFEEPIYRFIERSPDFYSTELHLFLSGTPTEHYLFREIRLPPDLLSTSETETASADIAEETEKPVLSNPELEPKHSTLWISYLIRDLGRITSEIITAHLIDSFQQETQATVADE